jgi:hypothetical protein
MKPALATCLKISALLLLIRPIDAGAAVVKFDGNGSKTLPRVEVSNAEFTRKVATLGKGKLPISIDRRGTVQCYQLDTIDWWVLTGQNSYYGGIYCHRS